MINSDQFKSNYSYLIVGYSIVMGILLVVLNISGYFPDGGLFTCSLLISSFPLIMSWIVVSEYISKNRNTDPANFIGSIQKKFSILAYLILGLIFISNVSIILIHNVFKPMGTDIKYLTFLISIQSVFGSYYQWLTKEIFLK